MTQEAKTLYGPRKLGEKEYEKQQKRKTLTTAGGVVYGAKKGGGKPAPEEPAAKNTEDGTNPFEAEADADNSGTVTLPELKARLESHPEELDAAIEAEFADGEPRKGAVRIFRAVETEREDGPREEVLRLLDAHDQD